MRVLVALVLGPLIGLMLLVFVRDRVREASLDRTSLSEQTDGVIQRWTTSQVPPEERLLTIVLSDLTGYSAPLTPPNRPLKEPGFLERFWDKLTGRGAGSRHSGELNFAVAVGPDMGTVDWRFRAGSSEEREALQADLQAALKKARGAGAVVTVVAHGHTAGVSLGDIQPLIPWQPEEEPLVASVIAAGSNEPAAPPPPWVGTWTHIWVEGTKTSAILHTESSARPIAGADVLSQTAVFRQELEKARPKPKTRTFRSLDGRVFEKPAERPVEAPLPAPTPPAVVKPRPVEPRKAVEAAGRIPLGDSGWSVVPPAGLHQTWVNRPAPGRVGTLVWTYAKANEYQLKLMLDFGGAGDFRSDFDDCRRMKMEPVKAEHRGYPVEVCSKPYATQDQGIRFGDDVFLLRDGGFIIKVRYDYVTERRQGILDAFYGLCDSLRKGQ